MGRIREGITVILVAATLPISGCMPMGEAMVENLYEMSLDRCRNNQPADCEALLASKCEADYRVCTVNLPRFQSEAREKLAAGCQAGDKNACHGLEAGECDGGNQATCTRLKDEFSTLAASCRAGGAADCGKIAAMPWPAAVLPGVNHRARCDSGDPAECALIKHIGLKIDVDKNAQFPYL